ncbi:MAG: hypothetical protein ACTSP1_12290 [Candidatus Freyarchaeota archaeon]
MIFEGEIVLKVKSYFQNQKYSVYSEVPMLSRHIDLVCVKPNFKEIVAIEAKVKDWKKALKQAKTYRLCAHKVYVALWYEYIHRAKSELFDSFGVGLLKVNDQVEEVQSPHRSKIIHPDLMCSIKNYVKRIEEERDESIQNILPL